MSEFEWKPKRTEECNRIITAPGQIHELELTLIDGRVQRVYKNLPPSLRAFWLTAAETYKDRDYLIFESDRYTYAQAHEKITRLASVLYSEYGVRKGDRVVIIMRNFPEFVVAFWAIQILGAIATLVNAWSPQEPLVHCLTKTNPKVIIVDPERADRLIGTLDKIKERTSLNHVLVARSYEVTSSEWKWEGMISLEDALASYKGPVDAWTAIPDPVPEDDATILFTSGTTGLPKGVLSTQRQFLTNFFNSFISKFRAILRNGGSLPIPNPREMQKATLISVPLFHGTGLTNAMQCTTGIGGKVVLIRKWDKDDAAQVIAKERVTTAGGVPSMVMDLIESSLGSSSLEVLSCGGAPASETMPKDVCRRFNKAVEAGTGYGLSETNVISTFFQGEDFLAHPTSCGLTVPVIDLLVVDPTTLKILPVNQVHFMYHRKGVNVMKGYYGEPAATDKAISRDGWFRSGDLGTIDEDGFVYIKDRVKDMIIRGGENIHSIEVENALYADEKIIDAAAVSVPDKRLGELVAAVVATKPHFHGQVSEAEVIEIAKKTLPPYAVPVMVLVQDEMIERNANGKIMKDSVRKRVRKEWARRLQERVTAQPKGPKVKL